MCRLSRPSAQIRRAAKKDILRRGQRWTISGVKSIEVHKQLRAQFYPRETLRDRPRRSRWSLPACCLVWCSPSLCVSLSLYLSSLSLSLCHLPSFPGYPCFSRGAEEDAVARTFSFLSLIFLFWKCYYLHFVRRIALLQYRCVAMLLLAHGVYK